jgi:hypothetical protein
MLLELSTIFSAELIHVMADVLTAVTIKSTDFLFMLAAELRLRPAPNSFMVKR